MPTSAHGNTLAVTGQGPCNSRGCSIPSFHIIVEFICGGMNLVDLPTKIIHMFRQQHRKDFFIEGNHKDFHLAAASADVLRKGREKPLAGVEFLITDSSGATVGPNNGIYKTDQYGRITLSGLEPGMVITAKETKTVDGYVLDSTPQSIEIKEGEGQTLTFVRFVP